MAPTDHKDVNSDRRKSRRIPAQLVVLYHVSEEGENLTHTGDVAANGLFIVTHRPPAPGTRLCLDLFLDSSREPAVRADAVVRWRRRWRQPKGMGVEIRCPSEGERERLARWLEDLGRQGLGGSEPGKVGGGGEVPARPAASGGAW